MVDETLTLVTRSDVLVHPALTGQQAELVHQALIAFLNSPQGQLASDPGEEQMIRKQLSELTYFFDSVVAHPERFPLRSAEDTKRIARAAKQAAKGPAQPQGNLRKRTQRRRMRTQKRSRQDKRDEAENYNQAVAKMEAERKEAQEAHDAAHQKMVDRFEALAKKDSLTSEELQEVLELFGSPEAAVRVRELRAGDDPQARLDAAIQKRDEQGAEYE